MESTVQSNTPLAERLKESFDWGKSLLSDPTAGWTKLDMLQLTADSLRKNYLTYLFAIPPLINFISGTFIGYSSPLGTFRVPVVNGIVTALVSYAVSFIMMIVGGKVIAKLAPSFGTEASREKGELLLGFSAVPHCFAAVLNLVPFGTLIAGLIALYGVYVLYIGFGIFTKVRPDRRLRFFVTFAALMIVFAIVVGALQAIVYAFV